MLELIDESLEAFFRASVPLSATDVDVSFEPPDREWSAKLTRPTVNIFLWDIRRSVSKARSGLRTVERAGATFYEAAAALPRSALRRHGLDQRPRRRAGAARRPHSSPPRPWCDRSGIPRRRLRRTVDPPTLSMAAAGEDHMDVFKALEGQLKPGLNIVLSTEFSIDVARPAGPPVDSIATTFGRFGSGHHRIDPPGRRRSGLARRRRGHRAVTDRCVRRRQLRPVPRARPGRRRDHRRHRAAARRRRARTWEGSGCEDRAAPSRTSPSPPGNLRSSRSRSPTPPT